MALAKCADCGRDVSTEAAACPNCGKPVRFVEKEPGPADSVPVPDYRRLAWLVIIFLCWPLGIPALVNANRAFKQAAAGDYQGAMKAARRAKTFCWWAAGFGILVWIFIVLLIISAVNQ